LLGEKELEKKRESFEMVSNAFYDMVRVVKPTGATIYYQYCPMAFNDKGAYWLSNADSIMNPYFGKKMLTCGEVKETLKY
jgi:Cu(I)/Ag(I) efflux system membrane fusion protein